MTYFNVKVQFTVEDSKGKIKKQNVNYLVDSQSCKDSRNIPNVGNSWRNIKNKTGI